MNIYQRLNAIKKKIGYVQKDKNVETYKAVTHDQVTAHIRQHFIDEGVLVIPTELTSQVVATGKTTKGGSPIIRFEAKYRVQFINVETPEEMVWCELTSHADDTSDKAPGKCLSYATKYAYLKVLQLETGEDDESRIPEQKRVDVDPILEAIKTSATEDDLKKVYVAAVRECSKLSDIDAHKVITAAKDKRKAELKAPEKKNEA